MIVASLPECPLPSSEGLYSSRLPHLSSPKLPPHCISHQISHHLPAKSMSLLKKPSDIFLRFLRIDKMTTIRWAQNLRDQVGTVLAPPRELAARFSGPKSARVILVLKAVLYVGSKSWWSQRLFWKITSNDALMFTYSNTSLSLNSLLSDKVFTSHLWSAWPWRCNDIFDLL